MVCLLQFFIIGGDRKKTCDRKKTQLSVTAEDEKCYMYHGHAVQFYCLKYKHMWQAKYFRKLTFL